MTVAALYPSRSIHTTRRSLSRSTMTIKSVLVQSVLLSLLFMLTTTTTMLVAAETSQHDNMDKERSYSKPWYARKIVLGGMEWPFTPVSVIGFFLIIYNVVRILTYAHSANASHILLTTDDAKTTLSKLKAEIGNDGDKFAKAAKDLSKCPSSRNGGNLGKFRQGDMAPPFDRAVFDKDNDIQTTLGPIQTSFGWHLIYVHSRKM